ncbi:Zn(II)2Cys6 transcription factor [Aspergillus luchuensis]|uniref:Zn(II)2Cys6 transcription factor n=1 Tax=Aspergillus kawachii TaxID=1069201 RepID=A0A146F7V7_ASPKA|nr:Zn(II)2Cys6 transcription factor [Aspergillus luchuensis]
MLAVFRNQQGCLFYARRMNKQWTCPFSYYWHPVSVDAPCQAELYVVFDRYLAGRHVALPYARGKE